MKDTLKILILEDSPYDAEEIIRRLEQSAKFDCRFRLAMDKATYLQGLSEFCPSVILSDHSLPQFDSKEALTIAREQAVKTLIATGQAALIGEIFPI